MNGLLALLVVAAVVAEFGETLLLPPRPRMRKRALGFSIENTTKQFLLDGRPFRYISGSIHYFRVHPALWADRLQRMRAAGLNAIQFYVPWNFHEVYEGKFRFNDDANLTRFLNLASDNELFVLLRIGPYSCGEWDNGGIPWWLLQYKDIRFRTSDKRYLKAVERWFNVLLPVLRPFVRKNGGPILMLQIENEYGWRDACDHSYMAFLRDLVWKTLGSDVLLYTTDVPIDDRLRCGTIDGVLATVDFGAFTSEAEIVANFEVQRRFAPNGPLVNSEFWTGWFVVWGQSESTIPTAEQILNGTKYMFQLGANFNYYMFHGGTNFAFWNGAAKTSAFITSYDYFAPISEAGDITRKYIAIRDFINTIPNWPNPPKELPANTSKMAYGKLGMRKVGSLTSRSILKAVTGRCVKSRFPLTFEDLQHPYGFVLYRSNLSMDGKILSIPGIMDYAYVYINDDYQGMMFRSLGNQRKRWLKVNGTKGSLVTIFVEDRGRDDSPVTEFKGIVSNVCLDGVGIENWEQCPIEISLVPHGLLRRRNRLLSKQGHSVLEEGGTPGFYFGMFWTEQVEKDTFVDMRGWGKGQLIVNGFDVGRYWPDVGPQMSLYVPGPVIRKWNIVILIELIGSPNCSAQFCPLNFIDHPIFDFALTP